MRKKIVILFCFLFLQVSGQDVYFKTLTTENGLSNNSVNDIENGIDGGLWIATLDGLNYFDGNEFKIFKHNQEDSTSISGNEILDLYKDKYNSIWALTDEGLSEVSKNNQFKNFFLKEIIDNVALTKDLTLIVELLDKRTFIYDGNKFVASNKKINVTENQKNLIYKKIILAKYPNLIINDVFIDDNKVLFATQLNGLFLLKVVDNQYQITNFKSDRYNRLSFKSNEIDKIHKDVFGGIWLAFKDGGVSLLQESIKGVSTIVPHPKDFPNLPSETVRALTKDDSDKLWIGYYSKGLRKFSDETNRFIPHTLLKAKENPDWNRIRSLYKDSKGAIWVGTYGGIIRIFNNNTQYFDSEEYMLFPNNRNYSFFEDNKQNLWVACWDGVAKLNINSLQFESFTNQELLKNVHVRDIYRYKNTLIIASENKSLLFFNLEKKGVKTITEKDGLAGNSIFSILYQKETNQFWVSCLGGVSILDEEGNVLRTITEKEGLPSHMVYGLLEQEGKIWASTTKGISKIDINSYKVEKINSTEKWQATEFSEGAYYKDKTGTLFFGGVKGISYFNPKDLSISTYLPNLNIVVDGKVGKDDIVTKPYNENYLKVKVIPIAFEKNTNNKVLYKLEGFDNDWQELKDDFTIFYKSLSARKYKLLVKNSLENNKKPISYTIIINKPFYLSSWFLLMLAFLPVLGLIYYLNNKNLNRKRYQENLEQEINKRTKTIENQKEELSKLYNNVRNNEFEVDNFKRFITDKFKQPLTLVLENTSKIKGCPKEVEIINSQVKTLMNRVIQWDYLGEVSNLPVSKKSITKSSFIENQLRLHEKTFINDDVAYVVNFKSLVDVIELDIIRCKLILQYIVNVFLNYRKPKTSYVFDVLVSEKKVELIFTSNNHVIIENLDEIEKYNRYFNAFKQLVSDLNGKTYAEVKKDKFNCTTIIPINVPSKELIEKDLKKRIVNLEDLPKDKKVILIYANENDFSAVECLLESEEYYLLFESDLRDVSKYISKTERFQMLVFYNVDFSSKVIELFNFISKNKSLPTLYISEKIDFILLEKIEEYNINELIQLPVSKGFIQNKVKQLLVGNYSKIVKQENYVNSSNQVYVNEAIKVIENNFSNPSFNVEFLIDELKISRVKCYRMFKDVIHQSPSDYINQYRMKKAIELLKSKSLSISQIAFECGYNDPKYFSKSFKKFYGATPKKYNETHFLKD